MGDYPDNYQKKDFFLLADVFQKFIVTCLKFYKLDRCHYFTSPELSLDAFLKLTGLKLQKVSDIDMYLFIEEGLRGGISQTPKRCSEANNKYLKEFDSRKPSEIISYLNMNNLYGWAVNGYLPHIGFKWLKNVDNFDINSISEKSPIVYILEFDLEYPHQLHVLHNNYPLAPKKLAVPYGMLSDYCQKTADKNGIKVDDVKKLAPNLGNKTNYVVHYKNLQLYLSLGMKLPKIHKVLKFTQSDWMKNYVNFNTENRKNNASSSFGKNNFKLMINIAYGKTIELLQKWIDVRLVTNEKDFLKYASRPTHITHKIFDKNYAAIHEIKPVLTLNKPICVGFTVPELSEWLMYEFHYNFKTEKLQSINLLD